MADAVWDLQKALGETKTPTAAEALSRDPEGRPRGDSDPLLHLSSVPDEEIKALDLAVPGGFRRHHLHEAPPKPVSGDLRVQINNTIASIYDPFIWSMLSVDNDKYDDMDLPERVQSLLHTPPVFQGLPHHYHHHRRRRTSPASPTETSSLLGEVEGEDDVSDGGRGSTTSESRVKQLRDAADEADKSTTLGHALMTLLKAFIGTGVLFLPEGFRSGGLVFSPLCLLVIAALTLYTMIRLLQCRELAGGTYGHIGHEAYGDWGRRMVQISIVLMQVGLCCTYVIFVAQNMAEVLSYMGTPLSTTMLIVLQTFIYIPLSWVRYMSYFTISNLIADVFILYGLAFILGNSFVSLHAQGPQEVQYFNAQDYPVFIGTAVFTFEGIGLVLPTQSTLSRARRAKFPALLVGTVIGLLFFYSFFAGINYLALGESIQPIVASSLPRNGWSISVQFGYSVAQLLSYPLFLFPAVKIMEEMLGFPKRDYGLKLEKNSFRAFVVIATVAIAYFGRNRLNLFVSLIGAFCCVPLSFIYPPLFYLKLQRKSSNFDKVVDGMVIVIGIVTFFFVTYSNLKKWAE